MEPIHAAVLFQEVGAQAFECGLVDRTAPMGVEVFHIDQRARLRDLGIRRDGYIANRGPAAILIEELEANRAFSIPPRTNPQVTSFQNFTFKAVPPEFGRPGV